MNCPACVKEMKKFKYFEVEIDRCRYCGGLWLDGSELSFFIKKGIIPHQLLTGYCMDMRNAKVEEGERECPRCGGTSQLQVITHKGINVDYCMACGGFWFDRGELLKILERYHNELAVEEEKAVHSLLVRETDKDGKETIRIKDEDFSLENKDTPGEWEDSKNPLTKELMSAGSKKSLMESVPDGMLKSMVKPLKVRVKEELSREMKERKLHARLHEAVEIKEEKQETIRPQESEEERKSVMDIILRFLQDLFSVFTDREEDKNIKSQ